MQTTKAEAVAALSAARNKAPSNAFVRSCCRHYAKKGYLTAAQIKRLAQQQEPLLPLLMSETFEAGAKVDVLVTARPKLRHV